MSSGKVTLVGRWMTLAGIVVQVAGLGATALQQANDPNAATTPDSLTGSPDHLLFLGGLVLTLAGLLLVVGVLLLRQAEQGPRGAVRIVAAVVVAAVLILAGGSFAYALQTGSVPRVASDGGVHFKNAQLEALEGGFHQNHAEVPITYAQLKMVTAMLETIRQATARYKDVKVAEAAGYRQISQDIPMLGAHFLNFDIAGEGTFDPARPPILLYEKVKGRWNLVGVNFVLPKRSANETQPDVIPGNLAAWHDHTDLCVTRNLVISVASQKQCLARNAIWLKETGWLLHVWVWKDSPQGVFSHINSNVN